MKFLTRRFAHAPEGTAALFFIQIFATLGFAVRIRLPPTLTSLRTRLRRVEKLWRDKKALKLRSGEAVARTLLVLDASFISR